MPLEKVLNNTARHQRVSSVMNFSADEMAALTRNIANAAIAESAHSKSSSVVEKNFQDLQGRLSSLSKQIEFEVDGQKLKLYIKAPEISSGLPNIKAPEEKGNLPIVSVKDMNTAIDSPIISLSEELPATLQKQERCATILDLLKSSFPKLTSSLFHHSKTIPRFVFASPIPLNQEDKGNFFPQIVSKGQIAYIAWDSSGSKVAKGFKEKTCDILFEDKEAFCGVVLSQDNLKGIEKGSGVSAHFMTSRVTVIGILITELPIPTQSPSWWLGGSRITTNDGRIACESDSDDDNLHCDGLIARGPPSKNTTTFGMFGVQEASAYLNLPSDNLHCDGSTRLIARGPSSKNTTTTFGMLGVQGASVSSNSPNLWDRPKKPRERLHPFCLEIVPQFSSENTPVDKEKLKMAIEMQLQKEIFAQFKKLNLR